MKCNVLCKIKENITNEDTKRSCIRAIHLLSPIKKLSGEKELMMFVNILGLGLFAAIIGYHYLVATNKDAVCFVLRSTYIQ